MKRTLLAALAALALLITIPARAGADSPTLTPMTRVAALAPRVPIGATRLGSLPSNQPLTISVVLQPSRPAELATLLEDLYDPTSPRYEQWLTPADFGREFGPSPAQTAPVTQWLHAQGLTDTRVEGFAVRATAPTQAVASALGVSFSHYRLADGATGYATTAAPLIPRVLASGVTAILGLSDTVRFHNYLDVTPRRRSLPTTDAPARVTNHAAPTACASARGFAGNSFWTPDQVNAIYKVNDLVNGGMDGRGTKIGLVELAPSRPADTNAYLACYGLQNKVSVVKIDGGAIPDEIGTLEAELDIQQAATAAPGAAIVSYEGPNSESGEYNVISQIVADNVPVVATTWGNCEAVLQSDSPGLIDSLHLLFQQAAAQGQSVFAASGDVGSEDCYESTALAPDDSLQVDNPADDPFVTAIGGTALEGVGVEPVWNDCEAMADDSCALDGGGGGGGGQSTHFLRPSWQPTAADAICSNCRNLPDISGNAGVGEVVLDSDAPGPDHWIAVGGTSIGAPRFAGLIADIDSGCAHGRIGNFAPKLDALAAQGVYGTALLDVTTGLDLSVPQLIQPGTNDVTRNNGPRYSTALGYDLASGIGSPLATGLSCPQITSITPPGGKAGHRVTLRGFGLEKATIKFGSTPATVVSATARSATVVVPAGSGRVNVSGTDAIGAGTRVAPFAYRAGYRGVAADGGVFGFGGAPFFGSPAGTTTAPIVATAVDQVTGGYWLTSADGNVYNFNAPALGSIGSKPLNQPIVGIAATKNGAGYWLVGRDGGVFAFGNARYFGSAAGMHLNQPIVGIAATKNGDGYWLVARDGGVFAFGNARFSGSAAGFHLNQPIVGMATDAVTGGYWLVGSDGGVFAFGGARFFGSAAGFHLNQPIVGMAADPSTGGYWLVARDGGVFAFNAPFYGSMSAMTLNQPVVAIAPAH